jgi:hypothetical protein
MTDKGKPIMVLLFFLITAIRIEESTINYTVLQDVWNDKFKG